MFEIKNDWMKPLDIPVTTAKLDVVERLKKAEIRLEILSEDVTDVGALKQVDEIKRAIHDAAKILEKPLTFNFENYR